MWEYQFSTDVNGRGVVDPKTIQLSSKKVNLGIDRHDCSFLPSLHQHIVSLMALYWSGYYPVGYSGDSSFVVANVDGKSSVCPRRTHHSSHKDYCCLDGHTFFHIIVVIIHP